MNHIENDIADTTDQIQHTRHRPARIAPEGIAALFECLDPQDVERFYQSYQLWNLQTRIQEIHSQIAKVQQEITHNAELLAQYPPSPVALSILAQLQANGVNDVELLDTMLDRGDDWLDHTMQLLEQCEHLDIIHGNYTEWCEHALEGAYDWIGSMHENDTSSESGEPATSSSEIFDESTEQLLLQKLQSEEEETAHAPKTLEQQENETLLEESQEPTSHSELASPEFSSETEVHAIEAATPEKEFAELPDVERKEEEEPLLSDEQAQAVEAPAGEETSTKEVALPISDESEQVDEAPGVEVFSEEEVFLLTAETETEQHAELSSEANKVDNVSSTEASPEQDEIQLEASETELQVGEVEQITHAETEAGEGETSDNVETEAGVIDEVPAIEPSPEEDEIASEASETGLQASEVELVADTSQASEAEASAPVEPEASKVEPQTSEVEPIPSVEPSPETNEMVSQASEIEASEVEETAHVEPSLDGDETEPQASEIEAQAGEAIIEEMHQDEAEKEEEPSSETNHEMQTDISSSDVQETIEAPEEEETLDETSAENIPEVISQETPAVPDEVSQTSGPAGISQNDTLVEAAAIQAQDAPMSDKMRLQATPSYQNSATEDWSSLDETVALPKISMSKVPFSTARVVPSISPASTEVTPTNDTPIVEIETLPSLPAAMMQTPQPQAARTGEAEAATSMTRLPDIYGETQKQPAISHTPALIWQESGEYPASSLPQTPPPLLPQPRPNFFQRIWLSFLAWLKGE